MLLSTATYFSYSAQHLVPINALNRKSKTQKTTYCFDFSNAETV